MAAVSSSSHIPGDQLQPEQAMDPNALAGMVFTLVFTGLIGGFVLLYPLSKRLGALMESKLRSQSEGAPQADIRKLTEVVRSLEREVRSLRERQEFTDSLLAARDREKFPVEASRERLIPAAEKNDVPTSR
jgi:hypothetical protein